MRSACYGSGGTLNGAPWHLIADGLRTMAMSHDSEATSPRPSSRPDASSPRSASPSSPGRVFLIVVAAGILASLVSWRAGEALAGWFQPRRAADASNPMAVQFDSAELDRVVVKNAALAYGVQGAVLGAFLGLAGGITRRSSRALGLAGVLGFVLGAALSAGAASASFTAYFRWLEGREGELLPSVGAHACAWAPLGAAAGLAFGIGLGGRGRIVRATIGGMLGAAVGALLYDVIGSVAFPLGKTGEPVAAFAVARLLAHALAGLSVALAAAVFAQTSAGAPPRR